MVDDQNGALEDQRAVSRETTVPRGVTKVFGDAWDVAAAYVELLATDGITKGLLGPREVPRLWERHVLNSVVVAELVPADARVADVGSGAGLPGIPLAIARPDLSVVLVEPLLRRSEFLAATVAALGLPNVTVLRSRAEDVVDDEFDVVTARAVAPLDRLAGWTLPIVRSGGRLLALKGASAVDELDAAVASLARMGATSWRVETVGRGVVEPPATVVVVEMGERRSRAGGREETRGRAGRRRRK